MRRSVDKVAKDKVHQLRELDKKFVKDLEAMEEAQE